MNRIYLFFVIIFSVSFCGCTYDRTDVKNAYDDGYHEGYHDGYEDGYRYGYDIGNQEGYDVGYNDKLIETHTLSEAAWELIYIKQYDAVEALLEIYTEEAVLGTDEYTWEELK